MQLSCAAIWADRAATIISLETHHARENFQMSIIQLKITPLKGMEEKRRDWSAVTELE